MSDEKYDFSDQDLSRGLSDNAYRLQKIGSATAAGVRYSSPWPWVRAIVISLLLWSGIAALIWRLF